MILQIVIIAKVLQLCYNENIKSCKLCEECCIMLKEAVRNVIFDSERFMDDTGDWEIVDVAIDEVVQSLEKFRERFEMRHNTIVCIVLAGLVGTWRGTFRGGKVVSSFREIFQVFSGCHFVKMFVEDKEICIEGAHHDGTHRMKLYFITENKKRRMKLPQNIDNWTPEDFEKIAEMPATRVDAAFMQDFGL